MSGFPGKDRGKQRHLTIGRVHNRENALFSVKNSSEKDGSLQKGSNLIYSNLSLPGMSGGAVLDRQGRLLGINTGAENEQIITQDGESAEINFGYALGIPISTVIGVAQRQLPTAQLQLTTTPASKLNQGEESEIYKIVLSTLTKPNQTASAKEWLDYANLSLRETNLPESITSFETAIKLLDRNSEILNRREKLSIAYYGLGVTWLLNSRISDRKKQDLEASVSAFKRARDVDPDFSPLWRMLGKSLEQLGQNEEALTAYNEAISRNKNDVVLYVEKGDILSKIKSYPDAINSYTEAIKLKPNHSWAYNNRGLVYLDQKQSDLAMADFNQAIQSNPQSAHAYRNRGLVYLDKKQSNLAIADFNQAIQIDPQSAMAYFNRGNIYMGINKPSEAIADFNRVIQLDPQLAVAYFNRGFVYSKQKQYDLAIADFNRAIQLNPQLARVYFNRGNIYMKINKSSETIADFNRAIQLNPQYADAYFNRAIVYGRQQQYYQAKSDLEKAADLFRAQNNTTGYQQAMTLLEKSKNAP